MPASQRETDKSEIDLNQRHPFLVFYLSAALFSAALIPAELPHGTWHLQARIVALAIGLFALWSFYRLFGLTDERQRDINNRALRFGFLTTLGLSLLAGFVRGFGSPVISSAGLLALMVIAWSVGLILYSWRYR